MSREYPDWVDPWKAAEGRRAFSGSMPLARLKRLLPLLHDGQGEARFGAAFAYDSQHRVTIRLEVEAELQLVCQASLEPYLEHVSRHSLLGVIESLGEEDLLPGDYEPVLAENRRLALAQLVEDELLLGMPQVPRNPQLDAPAVQQFGGEGTGSEAEAVGQPATAAGRARRPFADLERMMKQNQRFPGKKK